MNDSLRSRNYTYIVIDDEKWSRKGTIEKLRPLEEKIHCAGEASDGLEGLELVSEKQPDLVITDMKMPFMDGRKLLPVLAKEFPDVYIIVISGYKNFDYSMDAIRANAIDYLVKPFSSEDICDAVNRALLRIGEAEKVQDTIQQSQEYVEHLLENEDRQNLYLSLTGKITDNFTMRSSRFAFLNQAAFWITGIVHMPEDGKKPSLFIQKNVCFLPHEEVPAIGYLIIAVPSMVVGSREAYCAGVWKQLKDSLPEGCLVGFGRKVESLPGIASGIRDSIAALNQRPLYPEEAKRQGELFFADDDDGVERAPGSIARKEGQYPLDFMAVRDAMESGNAEDAEKLLRAFFTAAGEQCLQEQSGQGKTAAAVTMEDAKQVFRQLENLVQDIMRKSHAELELRNRSASIEHILDTIFTAGELWAYEEQFLENSVRLLGTEQKDEQRDLVSRICAYTEKHYAENLTGDYLAERFHVNRSFMSHTFKQKTGQAYVDYLNGIRIRKAQESLKHTEKKAYQVAAETGYDNVRHFYRVFKKVTGMTPEQYRMESRRQEEVQ